MRRYSCALFGLATFSAAAVVPRPTVAQSPAGASPSVVSVLPVRPDQPQSGRGAPEGSGVALFPRGYLATAAHVIGAADRIDVRLSDGRILPAALIARDDASDVALLKVEADVPPIALAPAPAIADRACAIGNAYGLGLSTSCGVVSALGVSTAGFNAVEDFVQTDAAVNPGASGGALVDGEGRLIGMLSAVFASEGDANVGVNFAVAAPLLERIAADLRDHGSVDYVSAGWRLAPLEPPARARVAGLRVVDLAEDGPAAAAGVRTGDILMRLAGRRLRRPRDAIAALARIRPGGDAPARVERDGRVIDVALRFPGRQAADAASAGGCPHPAPVCAARRAVFPVSAFDPIASGVRIGPDLIITNRHVVADRADAQVMTPGGPRDAVVEQSGVRVDLAFLVADDLPADGVVLTAEALDPGAALFAIGADIVRQIIRIDALGDLRAAADPRLPTSRLHMGADFGLGFSGGAVVDAGGRLVGVIVGGGEGRGEALPAAAITAALERRGDPLGLALAADYRRCATALDVADAPGRGRRIAVADAAALTAACAASPNAGQRLRTGRLLGFGGAFAEAVALHQSVVDETPNSVNARVSLLTSLQLAGRIDDMLAHARWLFDAAPDDPRSLRYGVQVGVWGGAPDLAEAAFARLQAADPRQAEAARRFIDAPPPRPQPR